MRLLVVRNDSNPKAVEASFILIGFLSQQGIEYDIFDSKDLYSDDFGPAYRSIASQDYALVVVLGGDGTILRTARLVAGRDVPILGINFGHRGFLANAEEPGVLDLVTRALAGELLSERRANLLVEVRCGETRDMVGSAIDESLLKIGYGINDSGIHGERRFFALNEVAISRGACGRMLDMSLDISDCHITDLAGDGIIVASSTGSTAYSLAAGGPLVSPSYDGLIVQPLAPHSLNARAIVTDASDVVDISLSRIEEGRTATLFVDGDMLAFDKAVVGVTVRRGEYPTTLLYADRDHFYRYAARSFFRS